MIHSLHEGRGTVLWDDCLACDEHADTLGELDTDSLMWLAEHSEFSSESHLRSINEMKAMARLKMMARIVGRAGLDPGNVRYE